MFPRTRILASAAAVLGLAAVTSGCSAAASGGTSGTVNVVAAENEYASVAQQIGGRYVHVTAIMSNPNTDPHTFEASSAVAQEVSAAKLLIQNGVGYDTFMNTIESAANTPSNDVIDVQHVLGLPTLTPNPHLWYNPKTMPAVAKVIASDLARLAPSHAAYFRSAEKRFVASLAPWYSAIAAFKAAYPHTPVATTEPVADYMLQASGADIETPWTLQADIMNGVDPSPQNVAVEQNLFKDHKVKVFCYNQQVTDPLTESFISLAHHYGIPVVGVYETMPVPGYDYQTWMLAEVHALQRAVADKESTQKL